MAKNTKKTETKVQNNKSKRGRPTAKETSNESVKKSEKKAQLSEQIVKAPALTEVEQLILDIYGNEPVKVHVPIPASGQKTETNTLVKDNNIDISRLPDYLVNLIDDYAKDFTEYINNPTNYAIIPQIQKKDDIAYKALKSWIEPKKELFKKLKEKSAGGVSVVESKSNEVSNKTVIDSKNVNDLLKSMPQKKQAESKVETAKSNSTQNAPFFRQAEGSTYQHHIHGNPVKNYDPLNPLGNHHPSSRTENKNIHHEMMAKSNPYSSVHAQQNFGQVNQESIVETDANKYLQDYLDSIIIGIKNSFQMIHWGFIPFNVLEDILSKCDKKFIYEIVKDGEFVYLNISDGTNNASSEKFVCN